MFQRLRYYSAYKLCSYFPILMRARFEPICENKQIHYDHAFNKHKKTKADTQRTSLSSSIAYNDVTQSHKTTKCWTYIVAFVQLITFLLYCFFSA